MQWKSDSMRSRKTSSGASSEAPRVSQEAATRGSRAQKSSGQRCIAQKGASDDYNRVIFQTTPSNALQTVRPCRRNDQDEEGGQCPYAASFSLNDLASDERDERDLARAVCAPASTIAVSRALDRLRSMTARTFRSWKA